MQGHELVIGRTYAYREKRSTASPLLKVKLLEMVGRKGKLKVRFEEGWSGRGFADSRGL
jgi:ribosomal protein L35AE/L33A